MSRKQLPDLAERAHGRRKFGIVAFATWFVLSGSLSIAEQFEFPDNKENREKLEQYSTYYNEIDEQHSRFAYVNGIRLHYLEFGDDNGLPLIWSHGYTSTGFEMLPVASALVDAGYHIFALSYRGHGFTQVEDYNFSLYTIADDIVALMNHLELDAAVVGGWSLGAAITTAFYDTYPERVLGLVLEDGGTVWPFIETVHYARLRQGLPTDDAAADAAMPTCFSSEFEGFATIASLHMAGVAHPLDLELGAMFYSGLRKTDNNRWEFHIDHKKLLGSWKAIDDPWATNELTLLARSHRNMLPEVIYRRIRIPVLLIDPTGDDESRPSRVRYNAKLAEQHPEWIHHIQYPDTQHMAHLSRPEWFVRDMKKLKSWIEKTQ